MVRIAFVLFAVAVFIQADLSRHAFGCSNGNDRVKGQDGCKPCLRPGSEPGKETENKPPDVTDIELDKTELQRPPQKEGSPKDEYERGMTVSVKTTAKDPEGDVLTYNYTISGGRIVGTGANVAWDLNWVMPGTYTITAAVDDGCGLCGAKVTKSVVVSESSTSDPACACPDLSILISQSDRTGTPTYFASLRGNAPKELTYNWTISEGTMVSGQGTGSIQIRAPQEHMARSATVTVEIGGLDPNCSCTTSFSAAY